MTASLMGGCWTPCARWVAESGSAFIARSEQCQAIIGQSCMPAAPESLLDAMRQVSLSCIRLRSGAQVITCPVGAALLALRAC